MKKQLPILIITLCCVLLLGTRTGRIYAQDIHFSQFYMSSLNINPAYAGAIYGMEAQANYKDQWRSVGSPYKTLSAGYDISLQKKKRVKGFFAAGINFFSDKAGDSKMTTTQGNLSIAGHVYIDRFSKFGGGLQIGFVQRSIDYSGLQWGNQYDGYNYNSALSPRENFGSSSVTYPDVSAGVLYSYDNTAGLRRVVNNYETRVNFGLSVFHVSQPHYSFLGHDEQLHVKFVAHGNVLFSLPNKNYALVPGFMYINQWPASEIYAGSLIRVKLKLNSKYTGLRGSSSFSLGGYFRAKDAGVIAMLMEFSGYAIGMSYDVNVSRLKTASAGRGGFEISLRFNASNPFIVQSRSRF